MKRAERKTISGRITVEGDATNLAIGSRISQASYRIDAVRGSDRQDIEARVVSVEQALLAIKPRLDSGRAATAEFNVDLLKAELTKTGKKDAPSAATITRVGEWLIQNVPEIVGELTGLFTSLAVDKVVSKAGSLAVDWVGVRFGGTAVASPDA